MIKAEGKSVICSGNGVELLQDFVNIMQSVRSVLISKLGNEKADEIIAVCGRYAYAENEAEEDMYLERIAEILAGKKEVDAN